MPEQDNQSATAGALQQGGNAPASSAPQASAGNDGMIVNLPSGERIELGEKYGQIKPFFSKRQ